IGSGLIRLPGGPRTFAYVLLVKGDEDRRTLPVAESNSSVSGAVASARGMIEGAGRRLELEYRAQLAAGGAKLAEQAPRFNGKPIDLRAGRVFLVDCTGKEIAWKQVAVTLPRDPEAPRATAAIAAQARELLGSLKKESSAVRQFLEGEKAK